MKKNKRRELMMIPFDKASELYLSTLSAEGKSPRYIAWLKTRLRFFDDYLKRTYGEGYKLQDLTVEEGRRYIRELMERDTRYQDHPMRKIQKGKLKIQYIHGLGRAVRSFSTWAYEEGYLDENVMRRLNSPSSQKLFPSLSRRRKSSRCYQSVLTGLMSACGTSP
jgi:site-specific recombinase XerD